MKRKRIKSREGPESIIEDKIRKKLELLNWLTVKIAASMYLKGFPDIFACHSRYGIRLIEVKNPDNYCFTPAQLKMFPLFCANGAGVWILTSDSDLEIKKLFGPPNWWTFLLSKF